MSNIFFKPFVGKNYQTGGIFGKRIMVLGESHYCGDGCADCGNCSTHAECADFTKNVMKKYLGPHDWKKWMNTLLRFERSLVGHTTIENEQSEIWNSVLFYNYLQVAMDGPRQAGNGAAYQAAVPAFYEVLDTYQPEVIIVWGKRLWYALPGDERWQEGEPIVTEDGQTVETGFYRLSNGNRAKVMAVYHPSTAYSWEKWSEPIRKFIE